MLSYQVVRQHFSYQVIPPDFVPTKLMLAKFKRNSPELNILPILSGCNIFSQVENHANKMIEQRSDAMKAITAFAALLFLFKYEIDSISYRMMSAKNKGGTIFFRY